MANVYVRSGASGSNNGSDWTNAYTTLAAALNAKSAGDNFWISEDHAESTGADITLTSPGTPTSPCTVICVNHSGTVPPVAADLRTTAVVACGAGAFKVSIGNGNTYWYGVTFKSGTGAVDWGILAQGTGWNHFKNCVMWKPGTTQAASAIELDPSDSSETWGIILDNVTMRFGSTGDSLRLGNRVIWKNTATAIDVTDVTPDEAINWSQFAQVLIEGVDFSGCHTASLPATDIGNGIITLKNCKIYSGSAVSLLGTLSGRELHIINTDSSGTNYRTEKHDYYADQTTETTVVRTGGATDGTTPVAWKIITGANTKWIRPFTCLPMAIWNDTTGSNVTVTVYGVWGGGAVPKNDDIWIEVSYMGSSGSPIATIDASNTKATYLTTNADQGTDSSTWGGSTTKFKMAVTLSSPQPAQKGTIYVTVKAAKASTTFYIDPKIVLS